MAENDANSAESSDPSKSSPSSSSSSRPTTITLPPRSFSESLFSGGFSPGPMTLVSSFFSDSDDFKSFSHLLAGAMASPAALNNKTPFPPPPPPSSTETNASIAPPPPMFNMHPGFSPLPPPDSPGFGAFSPQGAFGMSHHQALAQVSAQPAQANSQMLQSTPDHTSSMKESPDIVHSDHRSQASSIVVDKPAEDGYNWRKYGQKQVKGSEYPRSYYKCSHPSCPVKKKVERSFNGQVTEIIYKGQHSHQPPHSNKRAKDGGSLDGNPYIQSNYELGSQLEHCSGTSESEEVGDTEAGVDENDEDEPDAKRRNTEVRALEPASSHRTVTEPRIIVQTTSEVDLLDDGYRWRKYGQKVVKGNPYPRSYYKCTTAGCKVRKHVERAATDPRAVITTYEGKHSHDVPAAKGTTHTKTFSNSSAVINGRDYGTTNQQAQLRLKQEQIT